MVRPRYVAPVARPRYVAPVVRTRYVEPVVRTRYVEPVAVAYAEPAPSVYVEPELASASSVYVSSSVSASATTSYVDASPAVVACAPEQTFIGIGLFGGSHADGQEQGGSAGLLARIRLGRHVQLEGELSQTMMFETERTDRLAVGGLLYDIAPDSILSPYVVGAGGVNWTYYSPEAGDSETRALVEGGLGLHLKLGHHLVLAGDVRAGLTPSDRSMSAPEGDRNDGYLRGRLSAILYF